MKELVIGRIPYLVCAPYFFQSPNIPIKWVDGTPAELNLLLRNGEIDAAPSSSIEYAQNSDKYLVLRTISTGGLDRIQSVLLLSDVPWEQLNGKTIKLSPDSQTSNTLVRLLCNLKYKVACQFENEPVTHSAHVQIGNKALTELYSKSSPYTYDLAQEWYDWQHLPFSFGLWMFQKSTIMRKIAETQAFILYLKKCLPLFFTDVIKNTDLFLQQVNATLPVGFSHDFFRQDNYILSAGNEKALLRFYQLAYMQGLAPECQKIHWLPEV